MNVIFMSAAIPTRAPAASPARTLGRPAASPRPARDGLTRARARKPTAAATVSTCPAATSPHSSSGLSDQSMCARTRPAGSARSSRSRASTTRAKASAFHTFSQNVILAADVPPRMAAVPCSIVASGP